METIDYFIQQRGRAWRRKQKYLYRGRNCSHTLDIYKPEKKWKNLYSRSLKLARARQLKIEYPPFQIIFGNIRLLTIIGPY